MKNIASIIELLAETWPNAFSVYEARRKPLALGIHHEILAKLDGAVTPKELSAAMRFYTGNRVYRSRLIEGATRVALDGSPCGEVSPEHASAARPPTPAATPAPPAPPSPPAKRTSSFADLRAAGRQRREMMGAGG